MGDNSIWFDVTDLANWRGSLTGIQRTVFHLGEELSELTEIRFFQFSAHNGFVEVKFPAHPHETERLGNTIHEPAFGRRAFRRFPDSLLRDVKRATKAVVRRLMPAQYRWKLRSALNRLTESIQSRPASALYDISRDNIARAPFSPGDTVVVLGASWGIEGLNNALFRLRKVGGIKLVAMVYDLIPVYFPHYFGAGFASHYANYMLDLLHSADRLIAISNSTANDLALFAEDMSAPTKPIDVLRLGDDPIGNDAPVRPENFEFNQGFVLSVGTIEIRKNHQALYRAWSMAADRGVKLPPLVIVGRPGWLSSDFYHSIAEDPRVRGQIIILSGLDDGALEWLYKNCMFTVYPSWYEGWGLPIAESLNHGKVCVASDTSSMVEIGGELVRHVSPHDVEGIIREVEALAFDEALRSDLERRIRSEYKSFTWAESARELLTILEKETVA